MKARIIFVVKRTEPNSQKKKVYSVISITFPSGAAIWLS